MLDKAKAIQDQLIAWRRDFHMHPELGFQETRTAAIVADLLEKSGCRVRRNVGKTGVVADLGSGEPMIAIRADMDALPIQEANEVPYASQNPGVMHACGHDAHAALLLGAAAFNPAQAGDAKPLGALLDMTGDKVFLCTMLIVLAMLGRSPAWAAWLITSRELIVLFLRVVAAERGRPLPIATFGKLKTFMLYLLVPIALADASWQAVWFLALASTVSALASLVEYVVKMRADLAAEFLGARR